MTEYARLFGRGFLIVTLTAFNVTSISQHHYLMALAGGFGISFVWFGNHDKPRFEKQLRDRLSEEMVKVVEYLAGGNLSVIKAAARRFPNVTFASNRVDGRFDVGWYAQVNDLIVSHMEKFSTVAGSTLRGVEDWFSNFERVIGLEKDWRVVVQAHTHAGAWFPYKADRLLVESGCLCRTHGYQLTPRAGGRPQRQGYVVLEQRDGRTDVNSVRFVWLDAGRKVA